MTIEGKGGCVMVVLGMILSIPLGILAGVGLAAVIIMLFAHLL